jgi:hypothetical protein
MIQKFIINGRRLFITLAYLLVFVLLVVIVMRLLGYHFNKDYFKELASFNRQECAVNEYPTYEGHSGIQGCVFWMRSDYLERTQSWRTLFKRDDVYCSQKYPESQSVPIWSSLTDRYDAKCDYEAFKSQKQRENWDYLVSGNKDGFYKYCVRQICPLPPLFK